jgi:DNA-binding transcriptional ArsR family regulator
MEKSIDLILNPIRLRIIMALAGREMTARQVAETLGDVPPATFYRHLNRLAKAGMLKVVAERPVRGTVEKVYTVNILDAKMGPGQVAGMSREEHLRVFATFVTSLLDDFSRYLNNTESIDLVAAGVSYGKVPLELSDDELAEMSREFAAMLLPRMQNKPAPGRKRRILGTVVMPDAVAAAHDNGSEPTPKTHRARSNKTEGEK